MLCKSSNNKNKKNATPSSMTIHDDSWRWFFSSLLLFIQRLILIGKRTNNKQTNERKNKQIQRLQKSWRQQWKNSTAFFFIKFSIYFPLTNLYRKLWVTCKEMLKELKEFFFSFFILYSPLLMDQSKSKNQEGNFKFKQFFYYFFSANFHSFADWKFSNLSFVHCSLRKYFFWYDSLHAIKEIFVFYFYYYYVFLLLMFCIAKK